MKKSVFLSLLSLLVVLLFIPILSKAQTDPSIPSQISDVQEQVSSTIDPEIPAPGQQVTITLEAYGTDLNRAEISWTHNGKVELKGKGEAKFTFTAGNIGNTDDIEAVVTPFNGPAVIKDFSISPAGVDLLWEANTYTPPFYKGKALFSPQADVTFIAIPNMISNGSRVSSSNVVYKWSTDFEVQGDKSGYGKNIFLYSGPIILRPHDFQVDVYDSDNPDVAATSRITLEAVSPSVNLYEDHPLYGVLFNNSLLGSFNMNDVEKKIAAYPYFFSTPNKNANISYQWNLNDSAISAPPNQNFMTFRKTAQDQGSVNVNVRVDSADKLLQEAFGNVSLYFNNNDAVFLRQ